MPVGFRGVLFAALLLLLSFGGGPSTSFFELEVPAPPDIERVDVGYPVAVAVELPVVRRERYDRDARPVLPDVAAMRVVETQWIGTARKC